MKNKAKILLIFISSLLLTINSFSQYEEEPKESKKSFRNSGGLDFRLKGNSPNLGITYRRFFKESDYNLKASFVIGGNNSGFYSNDFLLYPTSDSTFIGVSNNNNYHSNFQKLEIGIEKKVTLWKLDFVVGGDIILGHRNSSNFENVFDVTYQEREQNGLKYYSYERIFNDTSLIEDYNFLQTTRNNIIAGAGINLGMFFDISPRLYASAMLGLQFYADFNIKERFEYKNEIYKEHLPTTPSVSTFNFDQSLSIGIHYRF